VSLAPLGEAPGEVTESPPAEVIEAAMETEHVQATPPPLATMEEPEHPPAVSSPPLATAESPPIPHVLAASRTKAPAEPEPLATKSPPAPVAASKDEPEALKKVARTKRPNEGAPPRDDSARRAEPVDAKSDPTPEQGGAAATGAATVVAIAQPGNPQPHYPRIARRRGIQGRVVIRASVLQDGSVDRAHVKQSSGHRILDEAARNAVQGWRFRPATRAGHAVVSTIDIPVTFRLRAGS
jgi:protein TonB